MNDLKLNQKSNQNNSDVSGALRGMKKLADDEYKIGKISKQKYDELIKVLDRPE